jgi:hypothetical protein
MTKSINNNALHGNLQSRGERREGSIARGTQSRQIVAAPDSLLMRSKHAAALLGLEEKTLANWRWRGVGPAFIKLPGRGGKGAVRYDRAAIFEWLAAQTRTSTSDDVNAGGANA